MVTEAISLEKKNPFFFFFSDIFYWTWQTQRLSKSEMSFLELQTTFKVDIWKCATLCRSATNSNNRNRLRLSKDGMKPCRCVPSWRTTIIILRSFLPNPTHHRVDLGLASIRQLSVSNMLLKGAAQKQPGSDLIPEGLAVTAQCLNVSAERQGSSSNVIYYIFIQKTFTFPVRKTLTTLISL